MHDPASHRVRYPLRAIVAVTCVSLFALVELGALGLFMMPLVPLVPVFIMIAIGNAMVLADVVQWAASLGRLEPVREPRAEATGRPRRESTQEGAPATSAAPGATRAA
jgi:hypothetical protein